MDSPELLFRSKDGLKKSSTCWLFPLLGLWVLSTSCTYLSLDAIKQAKAFLAWVRRVPKHWRNWKASSSTFPLISSFSYYSWLVISLTLCSRSLTLAKRSGSFTIAWAFPLSRLRCCLNFSIRAWMMAFLLSIYRSCFWIVRYSCIICPLCLKISYLN